MLTALGLGLLSAVVPYGLDQVIEGRELLGMVAIVIAVVLRTPQHPVVNSPAPST